MPRFGSFATDVRLTVRILLRDRAFTLTALAILALGIGANTAVFSVVDSVVLRPLAYSHSERLYTIWESQPFVSDSAGQRPPLPRMDPERAKL